MLSIFVLLPSAQHMFVALHTFDISLNTCRIEEQRNERDANSHERWRYCMTTTDYEQVLMLIRRLDRPTQARLVAEVVQALAIEPTVRPTAEIPTNQAQAGDANSG